ncbi:MAG: DUF3883 domain-containing protein [Ignavibacteria bacterium]|nr:DUF3883 domain-containing protein [Ignavibacteria bacterium]MDH7528210.1 DUF3883 domain-containing protein [Ignavibacteria bacterium]
MIFKKVKEKFLSEKLLPTSDGTYTKAGDALLARGKELTEFLDSNDIQKLFSKKHWLDPSITYDKTRELRDYLINELKVPEIDFESFAKKITAEFLQTKSDEWMIDFYGRLLYQQSIWSDRPYSSSRGVLRTKPIIRLENGEHIAPFDNNGNIQVYLPAETKSEYKTVKRALTEKEKSLKFLKELGLTKPDLFAEIKEFIIPKYQKENLVKDEKYFEDFEKLLKAYEIIPADKKADLKEQLSSVSFIDSIHNGTGENVLRKPTEVYFNDGNLKEYFSGYSNVYFISEPLMNFLKRYGEEKIKQFLTDLGVEDNPRRIEINVNLSREEKNKLRGDIKYTEDIYQKDYELEGLENFLKEMDSKKSFLLWDLLLKSIKALNTTEARKFFEGEYKWRRYQDYYEKGFDAKFIKTLKQVEWLVDKNNNFKKPSEITFSELSDNYIKESLNIDILRKALGFKPEIFEQLPENDRRILEIARAKNITPEEFEKILSERKVNTPEQEKEQWKPECEPETITPKVQELEPEKIVTPDLSDQAEIGEKVGDEKTTEETEKKEKEVEKTLVDKKAIGKWGEEYVYNALKKKYEEHGKIIETDSGFKVIDADGEKFEIIWLNKYNDSGEGYDFVIKQNGAEIEYIEVKSKTSEKSELIEVTGTQWEFARRLFDQNEGNKYTFYVVSNAGKKDSGIYILRNPIKLWKDGNLYAHPIKLKL